MASEEADVVLRLRIVHDRLDVPRGAIFEDEIFGKRDLRRHAIGGELSPDGAQRFAQLIGVVNGRIVRLDEERLVLQRDAVEIATEIVLRDLRDG